eukprot:7502849-Lingulodinium_polyedra.AAC.2
MRTQPYGPAPAHAVDYVFDCIVWIMIWQRVSRTASGEGAGWRAVTRSRRVWPPQGGSWSHPH